MKVLTIKQPWATLILQQDKKFEFRTWKTKYRGELLIHAGKSVEKETVKRLAKYLPKELPVGKIIGKVNIVDCIQVDEEFNKALKEENKDIYFSNSYVSKYAWKIEDVEVFDEENHISVNGKLSLWEYDLNNKGE